MSGLFEGTVALVTGGNRGIGQAFVEELLAQGASVYAGSRDPSDVRTPGAVPVELDVTAASSVAAAAARCTDVTLLINNAGYFANTRLVVTDDADAARREMDVNYFGPLATTRAFAPILGANGGGHIVNVLSVAGIVPTAFMGGYSPSKAAALFLSGITRAELEPQGTQVTALIVGSVDTRMASHVDGRKESPRDIAVAGLKAVRKGEWVADTDWMAVDARARLARDPVGYQRGLGKLVHKTGLRTGRG
ncbi:SDR family oxidoreductase [Virgisporangium aurantiacum]|uniref:Oxidoreductase n=1 Tax=Virgisporangium aurantiacum TaxID=175570 RepID=A0A8J3Z111_9ACTN|nr:SDR family oxidoreductase [Virgisporangium aurantiacum]GIJ55669.1 oxidoreductase [Virgisporangium aurantiacum]